MSRAEIPNHAPAIQAADWSALLEQIRLRPGMDLDRPSAMALRTFLTGLGWAEDYHGVPEERRLFGFLSADFEPWVRSSFNPGLMSVDSFWLASHAAESDEDGFSKWFGWYDRFRLERSGT